MTRFARLGRLVPWLVSGVLVCGLTLERLGDAEQPRQGLDFWGFFHPAAEAVAEGRSPYEVVGYGYSPVVAVLSVLPASTSGPLYWWLVLCLVCGLLGVLATWRTFALRLPGWRAPVFVGVAGATLLWSRPTTVELFLAQCQLLVLACLAWAAYLDSRGRPFGAGALVGLAGLVKTWPAGAVLWFLRRGAAGRNSSLAAAVVTGMVTVALFVLWFGPSMLGDWASTTADLSIQQQPAYSMFGLGRALFSGPEALVDVPALRWFFTVMGSLAVLGLLGVVMTRPGDPVLGLWHVVCVVLLLLPVSHYGYLVLLTPIVWVRVARLLDPAQRTADTQRQWWLGLGATMVVLVWWLVVFRLPLTGLTGATTVVLSTVVMLTASVLLEAVAGGRPRTALEG